MGNTPLSTAEVAHTYGKSTQQIDGVLTLKNQRTHIENTKQQQLGLSLPWHTSKHCSIKNNKRVKSLLMKSILARDWQKVLIRARLFPNEVHKPSIVEVPFPISHQYDGRAVKCAKCRVKLLPVHAACALRPPPEVVRALLSHAVASAFSNSENGKSGCQDSFGKPKPTRRNKSKKKHSSLVPLYHEQNTSLATVAVERMEDVSIGRAIIDGFSHMTHRRPFRDRCRLRLFPSTEEKQHGDTNDDCCSYDDDEVNSTASIQQSPNYRENEKGVNNFIKQMEDYLEHNGRCRSKTPENDASHRLRCSPRSIFVLNFQPSVLLPSPSSVRVSEKQERATNNNECHNISIESSSSGDLFSLENSIGDSDTDMTTSTVELVGNAGRRNGKAISEESSSLEYLSEESSSDSSTSSSELEAPVSDSDSDDSSNDSSSFLQLTADGGLTIVDPQEEDRSTGYQGESKVSGECHADNDPLISTSAVESSDNSFPHETYAKNMSSNGSPPDHQVRNCLSKFVPEDIRLDGGALLRSLPLVPRQSRLQKMDNNQDKRCEKQPRRKEKNEAKDSSVLLPIHIACLYGASASILNILLQEYPEGSSIEVLGMLPIHMVAANWCLSVADDLRKDNNGSEYMDSVEVVNFERDRLVALVNYLPKSLQINSSSHGLRPLEYARILLCYPANATNEGMLSAMSYLDSKEKDNIRFDDSQYCNVNSVEKEATLSFSNENDDDSYCNNPIEATSTCTTSGVSSIWIANDYSSMHSSSASNCQKERKVVLGELLSQGNWDEATMLLEAHPEIAKERIYYTSKSAVVVESDQSTNHDLLPIHIVCQIFRNGSSVPFGLVRMLVSLYSEGLKQADNSCVYSGLPLHLICDSFHCFSVRHRGKIGKDHFVFERLRVLQLFVTEYPGATSCEDGIGRLPLHRAILSEAPFEAIQCLVYRNPKSIAFPDRHGTTPFCLAKKMYGLESEVVKFFELVWV